MCHPTVFDVCAPAPASPPAPATAARRAATTHIRATLGIALLFGGATVARGVRAQSPSVSPPSEDSLGRVTRLAAEPTIIGPGVVSTPAEEFKATMSPDGHTLMYVVTDHLFRHMTIVEAHRRDTSWETPRVAGFSGVWRDGDPAFAPDGRTLLFISNRPYPGDSTKAPRHNYNMWHVERQSDGRWGTPVPYSAAVNTDTSDFAPSLTASGVLYFSRGESIYRAERAGSDFAAPQALPFHGGDPNISADERFIVFDDAHGQPPNSDLFVACRTSHGWSAPSRFLEPVNSTFNDGDPSVSRDGHWLYFFSDRYAPAPDRQPRPAAARYEDVEREALTNIYNGSRNLYQVDLSSLRCGDDR